MDNENHSVKESSKKFKKSSNFKEDERHRQTDGRQTTDKLLSFSLSYGIAPFTMAA